MAGNDPANLTFLLYFQIGGEVRTSSLRRDMSLGIDFIEEYAAMSHLCRVHDLPCFSQADWDVTYCNILPTTTTQAQGAFFMSVRKRVWTTQKGETKVAWVVDYADGSNERHIQTFSRKKDADDYHATVKVDVRKGLHTAPSRSVTIAEAAETWIKRVEVDGRERGTVEMYKQHVRLHIVPRLGRHKLANLSHKAIESFRDDLLKSMSRPMARKVLVSFKSLLRVAKFSHIADDVRISSQRREERRLEVGQDIPTPGEIKRLIKASTPGHQRAMFLIAATCGLRASELRGLRWRDVDLKAATLRVTQRADRWGTIGAPKSAAVGVKSRWHRRHCQS